MAASPFHPSRVRELFVHAASRIEAAEPELNSFDAAIGDGDHGITMRIGFQAIRRRLSELPDGTSAGKILQEAGRAFMSSTGGAIGVVLGRAFISAGIAIANSSELGSSDLKQMFVAMEESVIAVGKAKPGDKTLLDPLHAVNEALALSTGGVSELLDIAASAADVAARSTADLLCRIGRASRLGTRALGHPDPGAMSFALLIAAFAEQARNMETQAVNLT
jgi:phosphoenolpyruvate---glycerone phosphotransferase subunit DhaL